MKKILFSLILALSLIIPGQAIADSAVYGGFLPCTSDDGTTCITSRYINSPGIYLTGLTSGYIPKAGTGGLLGNSYLYQSSYSLLWGDTANTKNTYGFTVNQLAADDEIISLKSSDVSHPYTALTEADTYGYLKKLNGDSGGLSIGGITDSGTIIPLQLAGFMGSTNPTDTVPAINLVGIKSDGGTGYADIGAAETVFRLQNNATTLFSVLGAGNFIFGTSTVTGTSLAKGLMIDSGTAPTTSPADAAQLYVADHNGQAGYARLHQRPENVTYTPASPVALLSELEMYKNPLAFAQGINMTYAASASMNTADNINIDFDTGNFTLVWKGSLPDWTPSAAYRLLFKYAPNYGYELAITPTAFRVGLYRNDGGTFFSSTAGNTFVDGTEHEIATVITRETASTAGSVIFYVDGFQLGASVAITAASPVTVSTTGILYLLGTSTERTASVSHNITTFNRALTAAEVLSLYRNGIDYADKWGSQTAVYTSDFSAGADSWAEAAQTTVDGNIDGIGGEDNWLRGTLKNGVDATHIARRTTPTLVTGKKYRITGKYFIPSTNSNCDGIRFVDSGGGVWWSAILNTLDAATTFTAEFTATTDVSGLRVYAYDGSAYQFTDAGGDDVYYIKDIVMVEIGATLALESEGIQRDAWKDSSTNGLNASYPASGYSFLRPIRTDSAEGLLSVTNVSLAADADTTLYTVPTGKRLVLTKAILVVGADAGTSVISVGADGAETDWLPNNTLSAIDAANDAAILQPVPNTTPVLVKSYAGGTVIQAKVSSHAGGATNSLSLFGYLY